MRLRPKDQRSGQNAARCTKSHGENSFVAEKCTDQCDPAPPTRLRNVAPEGRGRRIPKTRPSQPHRRSH
eukprot:8279504-Pyramimonas_sp.AAC.1